MACIIIYDDVSFIRKSSFHANLNTEFTCFDIGIAIVRTDNHSFPRSKRVRKNYMPMHKKTCAHEKFV